MKRDPSNSGSHQRGVVLVVALIMMAVIAISSGVAIRLVTAQDMIGSNQRLRNQALQAAESALRYCEAIVATPTLTATQSSLNQKIGDAVAVNYTASSNPNDPSAPSTRPKRNWESISNWVGSSKMSFEIPSEYQIDGALTYDKRPECLIERIDLPDENATYAGSAPSVKTASYIVTARGFSAGYSETSDGTVKTGSAVWVQSTVQVD